MRCRGIATGKNKFCSHVCEKLHHENEDLKRRRAEFLEYSGKASREKNFFTLHNDAERVRLSKFPSDEVMRINLGHRTLKETELDAAYNALADGTSDAVTLQLHKDEKMKGGDHYYHVARGKRVKSWMLEAIRVFA